MDLEFEYDRTTLIQNFEAPILLQNYFFAFVLKYLARVKYRDKASLIESI